MSTSEASPEQRVWPGRVSNDQAGCLKEHQGPRQGRSNEDTGLTETRRTHQASGRKEGGRNSSTRGSATRCGLPRTLEDRCGMTLRRSKAQMQTLSGTQRKPLSLTLIQPIMNI